MQYLDKIDSIKSEFEKVIIWQNWLIESLIVALLAEWHIILEGVPWLAKTLSIQTLSKTLDLHFTRISFTPDLLPWDLIGWEIYNQSESKFYTKKWPIFTNFLLADEINRAPSKVQSALLEAMQERKVTIASKTYDIDYPFFVLATQNPIEQEWTYALPEAQLDRFLLKVIIDYPSKQEELDIMKRASVNENVEIKKILNKNDLLEIQSFIQNNIFVDEKIYHYVRDIIFATRFPDEFGLLKIKDYISFGASPRASIWLIKTAKVQAFLNSRDYVTPDDIKKMSYEILRHRIWLSFEALWQDINADFVIKEILSWVIVP